MWAGYLFVHYTITNYCHSYYGPPAPVLLYVVAVCCQRGGHLAAVDQISAAKTEAE